MNDIPFDDPYGDWLAKNGIDEESRTMTKDEMERLLFQCPVFSVYIPMKPASERFREVSPVMAADLTPERMNDLTESLRHLLAIAVQLWHENAALTKAQDGSNGK